MRILILGGTGFIGPHQVRYARERGHTLTLFNRGRTNPELFPDIEQLRGDRDDDLASLEGREWDVVIDNSASIPRWVRQSAQLLKDAADRYLFVSSISAFADFSQPGMDETAPVATIDDPTIEEVTGETYGALKALCEEEARAAFGDRALIVRPGLIIGPGDPTDRFTYWPVRVHRGGEVLAPGTPADPVQVIDARDLTGWMIRMLEGGESGTYNATGNPTGIGDVLDEVRTGVGSDATFTFVPTPFLEEQEVRPWVDMPIWVPPAEDMVGFGSVSIAAALEKGLEFRPLDEIASDTLEWFQTLPEERQSSLRFGIDAEREVEVLTAWKEAQAAG
jgi:2'-hydroxyisoflavone reductase